MPLAEILLASMLSFGPPDSAPTVARFTTIAEGITDASELWSLWPGREGRTATATLLLAIAIHESGLREDVQTCHHGGDGDRSKGLFQLMHPVATEPVALDELCASPRLQAAMALRVLWRHRDTCASCPPQRWINGYASGDGRKPTRAAREISTLWVRLAWKAGVAVSPDEAGAGLGGHVDGQGQRGHHLESDRRPRLAVHGVDGVQPVGAVALLIAPGLETEWSEQ